VTTHYVYRCYDADGNLLYVGCTNNPQQRYHAHMYWETWWAERITHTVMKVYGDRLTALLAEEHAIKTEHPIHNSQHAASRKVRRTWDQQHYINWLTALLERPHGGTESEYNAASASRIAAEYSARFSRDLRADVGRVKVGCRRYDDQFRASGRLPEWRTA
jgi:predicted GIY-YIG superfamily endonuclease